MCAPGFLFLAGRCVLAAPSSAPASPPVREVSLAAIGLTVLALLAIAALAAWWVDRLDGKERR